jgi:hypothetical protein
MAIRIKKPTFPRLSFVFGIMRKPSGSLWILSFTVLMAIRKKHFTFMERFFCTAVPHDPSALPKP